MGLFDDILDMMFGEEPKELIPSLQELNPIMEPFERYLDSIEQHGGKAVRKATVELQILTHWPWESPTSILFF
jgi:hypothetical protein